MHIGKCVSRWFLQKTLLWQLVLAGYTEVVTTDTSRFWAIFVIFNPTGSVPEFLVHIKFLTIQWYCGVIG